MASKRETIPYGVGERGKRNSSGPRRRMSGFDEIARGPMVSPLPLPISADGAGDGEPLGTAVTQEMPAIAQPAVTARPAMLPPSMPAGAVSSAPPPASSALAPKVTTGVYRYTAPISERRRKKR
jgi:hypothetical protein